jgi:ribosomal protein S18 acetylase RimI-like enzyme
MDMGRGARRARWTDPSETGQTGVPVRLAAHQDPSYAQKKGGKVDQAVTLRCAVASDAAAITALTRDAYVKWVAVIGREPLPMTVDYAKALIDHRFDLVFVGSELAALIETVPQDDALLIVNVAVDPGFQGRGFGGRLLRLAEQMAADAGLVGTRLYTNKQFTENLQIYDAFGYRIDREVEFMGGIGVYMSKTRPG